MITIGTPVHWRPELRNAGCIGVVTAERPGSAGRMLEIDGRGWWVSEGLLRGDGTMNDMAAIGFDRMPTVAEQYPNGTPAQQMYALQAERDGLALVVAQQCELIMQLQAPPVDAKGLEDLRERADDLERLQEAVRDYLREATGSSNPSSLDCRKLGAGWENMLAELGKYE